MTYKIPLEVRSNDNGDLAKELGELQPMKITAHGAFELDHRFNYWRQVRDQDIKALILRTFAPYWLYFTKEVTNREGEVEEKKTAININDANRFNNLDKYIRHAPTFFDLDFFERAPVGFTCRNGFVDLSSGSPLLEPSHPNQRSRIFLDFDFDPKAKCPYTSGVIDSFFVEDKDGDGPGKRQALLEFYAMCLLGQVNKDKRGRILWVTGEPGTGKSTLLESLNKAVFPSEFTAMVDPKAFSEPEQLLDLVGKLINFSDEVDERTITNTATVRKVVAGSEMKVRQLYRGFFNARFTAGHLMIANVMPRQADESGALIDRTIHIHFTHRFKRRNEDAHEVERQIVAERAGIINLLLEHYTAIMARPANQRNVQAPASAVRRQREMLEDANIYRQFVKVLKVDPEQKRRASDLLQVFNLFKHVHGYHGPNVTSGVLARKVLELRPELKLGESGGAAVYGFSVEDETQQLVSGNN